MSEYLIKAGQRIAQLERELAECKEDRETWKTRLEFSFSQRDALAAIVKQMREALHNGAFPGDNSVLTLHKWVQEALALDMPKAEAIMRQRAAEVLSKATDNFTYGACSADETLRRMADELLKGEK